MKHEFPTSLTLVQASAGSRVDLQRIQNQALRLSLEEMRSLLATQSLQLAELTRLQKIVEKRTQVLAPATGFSVSRYSSRITTTQMSASIAPPVLRLIQDSQDNIEPTHETVAAFTADSDNATGTVMSTESSALQSSFVLNSSASDDAGTYVGDNGDLRAFANGSPKSADHMVQRKRSQVDLVLPPTPAFTEPGQPQFFWPPVFGQRSVTWTQVFDLIKRPELLWNCWKPSKTVDKYSLREQWACWSIGEGIEDPEGNQTAIKPPLRELERHFPTATSRSKDDGVPKSWRSGAPSKDRKSWQRFREIPEFIDAEAESRDVSPLVIIQELEDLQKRESKLKGLSALSLYIKTQRESLLKNTSSVPAPEAGSPRLNEQGTADDSAEMDIETGALGGKIKRKKSIAARRPRATKKPRVE